LIGLPLNIWIDTSVWRIAVAFVRETGRFGDSSSTNGLRPADNIKSGISVKFDPSEAAAIIEKVVWWTIDESVRVAIQNSDFKSKTTIN
jgi:hypothetical protein